MRLVVSVAVSLAALWLGFVENDWLDRRPVERILFLGDSYTYYNEMPAMIEEMADSAGSEIRYDITMQARPGYSLQDHWNDRATQSLLSNGNWSRVIIQPETYVEVIDSEHHQFRNASRIFDQGGAAQRAVVVSWTASERHYRGDRVSREEHFQNLEINYRGVASRTGASVIDVARVWEDLLPEDLPFSLYHTDGNHPSLEGSYLAALVIYSELAQSGVENVTYVPRGMSEEDAAFIRDRVQQSLQRRRMAGFGGETRTAAAQ